MASSRRRSPSDPNSSILHLMHRAGQAANNTLTTELARHRVTPRQFVLMQVVAGRPGCSQRDLEDATGVDRSTVADIVARLIARGIFERVVAETDRRARSLRLTTDGRKLIRRCRQSATSAERTLLESLAASDQIRLRKLLEFVSGVSDKPSDPGGASKRRTED